MKSVDGKLVNLPISKIVVKENQNIRLDVDDFGELMQSIKQHGVLQPIGVVKEKNTFRVCWGHRRLEACKKLGWNTISAIILTMPLSESDYIVLNALENVQRKDITQVELGRVCIALRNAGLSPKEIAVKLAMPEKTIETAIKLFLRAPESWVAKIKNRGFRQLKQSGLNTTVASKISAVHFGSKEKDIAYRDRLYRIAMQEDLSKRDLDVLINLMMTYGLSPEEAFAEKNNYVRFSWATIFNKNEFLNLKMQKINIKRYLLLCLKTAYPALIPSFKNKQKGD